MKKRQVGKDQAICVAFISAGKNPPEKTMNRLIAARQEIVTTEEEYLKAIKQTGDSIFYNPFKGKFQRFVCPRCHKRKKRNNHRPGSPGLFILK